MRSSKRAAAVAALIAVTELKEPKESRKRKSSPAHKPVRKQPSRGSSSRLSTTRTPTPTVRTPKKDSTSSTPKSKEEKNPTKGSKESKSEKRSRDVQVKSKQQKHVQSTKLETNVELLHQSSEPVEDQAIEQPSEVAEEDIPEPASTSVEENSPANTIDDALQLFSQKHGLSKTVFKAALSAEQQETLPSINDPDAIDAFFRRNRRRSFKDLIPEYEQLVGQNQPVIDTDPSIPIHNGSIPDDHPMKHFVEQSDKEMSVKEALARGFRNYKVRLPKIRRSDDIYSQYVPGQSDLAGLLYNSLPSNNYDDLSYLKITETTTLNDLLASAFRAKPEENRNSSSPNLPNLIENSTVSKNNSTASDCDVTESRSDGPIISPCDSYSLPPFCEYRVEVSKGYKGGFYIMGIRYIPISNLIEKGAFIVPLQKSIRCLIGENVYDITFHQMLANNGIIISNPNRVDELKEIFASSLLVVHHGIVEVLVKASTALTSSANIEGKKHPEYEAIRLSKNAPPMACYKPNVFVSYLGTAYGGNEIVNLSNPSRGLQQTNRVETDERELSTKEKLYVLTNSDAGISRELICMRYNIKSSTVDKIIANREDIQRMAALVLMEEAKNEESNKFTPATIAEALVEQQRIMKDGIKKKNRVRRTSFVGLNILMWRFFKDCADNGIPLNGKMLKEHAMIIARQLGLDNFKGSEGWLDAFKRRHKIDLKQMTGSPANYDEDIDDNRMDADDIEDQLEDREHSGELSLAGINAGVTSDALFSGMTAALLNCVEKAALPMAVASISNTKPLDLANLFRPQLETNLGSSHNGILPSSSGEQIDDHDCSINNVNNNPLPFIQQPSVDENGLIAAIIKSAALPIPNKELCSAMNTIRCFIVAHDPTAMPLFLELQEKLAVAEKSNR